MQETSESAKRPLRFENPFPFFAEAANAASRLISAQRDYLLLSAEQRARREARRIALLAAALISLNLAVTLVLFWATHGLYRAGWAPGLIASLSAAVFGSLGGFFCLLAKRTSASAETTRLSAKHDAKSNPDRTTPR